MGSTAGLDVSYNIKTSSPCSGIRKPDRPALTLGARYETSNEVIWKGPKSGSCTTRSQETHSIPWFFCSASCSGCFNPGGKAHGIHYRRRWVGTRSGLDEVKKMKVLPIPVNEPWTSRLQCIAAVTNERKGNTLRFMSHCRGQEVKHLGGRSLFGGRLETSKRWTALPTATRRPD